MNPEDLHSAEGRHEALGAEDGSQKFMGQKERRRSSASKITFYGDYANMQNSAPVMKALSKNGDKTIVFSDIVIKVNKRNKMQERILLITENNIYNIDPSHFKFKRAIKLTDLQSVSLSLLPDNFFALHVPQEYDYLMVSSKKTEIVTRLCETYRALVGNDLRVNFSNCFEYRIDDDTIKEITFSRVDGGVSTQISNKPKAKK
eukprot:TRINITY_DN565_c0_g1_i1.p1 TRINITY_DN565_c0_g1~~TRINITY_DN565_c0_g1_i1.p1  ORF type:complete len:203 (+),score=52.73 TRINITY_DN565_c0_g1_i1:67-675(+)